MDWEVGHNSPGCDRLRSAPTVRLVTWQIGMMGTWGCDSLVIVVAAVAAVCCCCQSWERRDDDEKRTKNSAGHRRAAFHPFNFFFSSLSSLGMTVVVVWRIRDPLDNIIRCISACLSALRAEARARPRARKGYWSTKCQQIAATQCTVHSCPHSRPLLASNRSRARVS